MIKTNYHTHSYFCDGHGTPAEIIEEAINKGFSILGFSSHSAFPFADNWHIFPDDHKKYMEEVREAAKTFEGKIDVLCGFEADYISGVTKPSLSVDYKDLNPDYLIGAVHYVSTKDGILGVDDKTENVKKGLEKLFFGNGKKCVQEYFFAEREMLSKCDFTILAHPDLIRKRNGPLNFFNESDSWYRKEIKATADKIKKAGVIAEINTGAISRGAMDDLYPSKEFLSLLHERNVPITISSDSHDKKDLDSNFDRALKAALDAGYTEIAYLDKAGTIKFQKIEL